MLALVTTFMTTPLLEWIYPARLYAEKAGHGTDAGLADKLAPALDV